MVNLASDKSGKLLPNFTGRHMKVGWEPKGLIIHSGEFLAKKFDGLKECS